MAFGKCIKCGKESEKHAKGMCTTCYKKYAWVQKPKKCKRCERELPHHSKGLCAGCYQFVYHSEKNKAWNYRNRHHIDLDLYKKVTSECLVCGFSNIVDLHHLDENKENNKEENLVGLCPNHHKMFHDFRYKKEITDILKEKGKVIPESKKMNYTLHKADQSAKTSQTSEQTAV